MTEVRKGDRQQKAEVAGTNGDSKGSERSKSKYGKKKCKNVEDR